MLPAQIIAIFNMVLDGRFIKGAEFMRTFGKYTYGNPPLEAQDGTKTEIMPRSPETTISPQDYEAQIAFVTPFLLGVDHTVSSLSPLLSRTVPGVNIEVITGRGLGKQKVENYWTQDA